MKYTKCGICDGAGSILVPVGNYSEGTSPREVREKCEDCCGTGRDYGVDNESNKVHKRPPANARKEFA